MFQIIFEEKTVMSTHISGAIVYHEDRNGSGIAVRADGHDASLAAALEETGQCYRF